MRQLGKGLGACAVEAQHADAVALDPQLLCCINVAAEQNAVVGGAVHAMDFDGISGGKGIEVLNWRGSNDMMI